MPVRPNTGHAKCWATGQWSGRPSEHQSHYASLVIPHFQTSLHRSGRRDSLYKLHPPGSPNPS